MKRVLIIDGNSYLYRAAYAFGTARDGVANGMIKYISEMVSKQSFEDVVVCWDKGKSRWRREVYPEYKAGRKEKQKPIDMDAVHEQAGVVRSYLRFCGIRQVYVEGVEADDLISWISDYYKNVFRYDEIIISTSDKDLWQLLDDKVMVYDHLKSKLVNNDVVVEELGINPKLIPDLKSLSGDPSDNINGVIGIGNKTAIELINKYGGLGKILDPINAEELSKSKRTKKILDQSCSAEFVYGLVKIPRLDEAIWYLNNAERDELIKIISDRPFKDRLEFQMVMDRLGDCSFLQEKVSSLAREDLTGMKAFLEIKEEERYSSLTSLDSFILQCRRCSLRNCCGEHGPTLPDGFNDVEIMVVGRNPGQDELVGGKPFIGRAGNRLDKFLKYVGLTRRDCWTTNVNKCYSEDNRPPIMGEILACSSYLRSEINLIKPKFIMAFGNEAMAMLTPYGYSGVTKHCGEILEKPSGILGVIDAWVAICVHPSMALRSQSGELHMKYAAEQVKKFLDDRR